MKPLHVYQRECCCLHGPLFLSVRHPDIPTLDVLLLVVDVGELVWSWGGGGAAGADWPCSPMAGSRPRTLQPPPCSLGSESLLSSFFFLTMCMKHPLFSATTLSLNCSLISSPPSHTVQSRWRWCRCSEYTTWGQRAALVFHVFLYVTFCTYPVVCCEMCELIMLTTTIDTAVVHIHTYMQNLTCLM